MAISKAAALLIDIQWSNNADDGYCPVCWGWKEYGHSDCELADALIAEGVPVLMQHEKREVPAEELEKSFMKAAP